jgi:hypothetical protein
MSYKPFSTGKHSEEEGLPVYTNETRDALLEDIRQRQVETLILKGVPKAEAENTFFNSASFTCLPYHAANLLFTLPREVNEENFPEWVRTGQWTSMTGRNLQLERVVSVGFQSQFMGPLFDWLFTPKAVESQQDKLLCTTYHWHSQSAARKSAEGPAPMITHHITREEYSTELVGMCLELPGALWMKAAGMKAFRDGLKAVTQSVWNKTVIHGLQGLLRANDNMVAAQCGPNKFPKPNCTFNEICRRMRTTSFMLNKRKVPLSSLISLARADLAYRNCEVKHLLLSHDAMAACKNHMTNLVSHLENPALISGHRYGEGGAIETARIEGGLRSLVTAPLVPEGGKSNRLYCPFQQRREGGEYVFNSRDSQPQDGLYHAGTCAVTMIDFSTAGFKTITADEQRKKSSVVNGDGKTWSEWAPCGAGGKDKFWDVIPDAAVQKMYGEYLVWCADNHSDVAKRGDAANAVKKCWDGRAIVNVTLEVMGPFLDKFGLPWPLSYLLCSPAIGVTTTPAIACDDDIGAWMSSPPVCTTSTNGIDKRLLVNIDMSVGVHVTRREAVQVYPNAYCSSYDYGGARKLQSLDTYLTADGVFEDGCDMIVIPLPFDAKITQPNVVDLRGENNIEMKRIDRDNNFANEPHYPNPAVAAKLKEIFNDYVRGIDPWTEMCSDVTTSPVNTAMMKGYAQWYRYDAPGTADPRFIERGASVFGSFQSPESIAQLFGYSTA